MASVADGAGIGIAAREHALVRAWLFTVAALVFAIVVVGGATRLTESGLSITEWELVTGVLPPLSREAGSRNSRSTGRSRNTPRSTAA